MAKFEIYKDADGLYRWRLKAANGEKVCWGEAYSSKQAAIDSINWVKKNAPDATVEDLT